MSIPILGGILLLAYVAYGLYLGQVIGSRWGSVEQRGRSPLYWVIIIALTIYGISEYYCWITNANRVGLGGIEPPTTKL